MPKSYYGIWNKKKKLWIVDGMGRILWAPSVAIMEAQINQTMDRFDYDIDIRAFKRSPFLEDGNRVIKHKEK